MKKKIIFKIFNICLLIGVVIFVPLFSIKTARDYEIYKEPTIDSKIYTIWHIETFEGGGKSRISYLNSIARTIEKEHAGVLLMVKTISPEQLEQELVSSIPHIISFGFGVGKTLINKLQPFENTYNIRDELLESATFNGSLYALPYIASGYALITNGKGIENFHCGTNGFTRPENVYKDMNTTPIEIESQYEAYKDFVHKKDVSLLGTGRDVFRVNNLNKLGRKNAMISPVDSYTDLIQYLGVTTHDNIIDKFCAYALNDKNQNSLYEYSLFSSKYIKLYTDGIYNDMEDAIFNCYVPKVFE